MDIRIVKRAVTYCTFCNDVRDMKEAWDEGQRLLVDNGEQEERKSFPGVPGYAVKDADDFKYMTNEVCEKCMHTVMKGVHIILDHNLTGISIDTNE